MEQTSLTLLDRLRGQSREEDWTRLVLLYQPFIERFIRFDIRLADDAEDIGQEVLKKVVEHLPRFRRVRDGSFRAWLKTITVNEVNHFWRKRLRHRAVGHDKGGLMLEALADPAADLSQQWDREHDNYVLHRLLDLIEPEFSPTTWNAFRLRVFEEMPTAKAAVELQISKNAVHIAKSRVLARLRE